MKSIKIYLYNLMVSMRETKAWILIVGAVVILVYLFVINLPESPGSPQDPFTVEEEQPERPSPANIIRLESVFPEVTDVHETLDNYEVVILTFDKPISVDDFEVEVTPEIGLELVLSTDRALSIIPEGDGWGDGWRYKITVDSLRLNEPIEFYYSGVAPVESGFEDRLFRY